MPKHHTDHLIIGTGITGLTLAFYLKEHGKNFILADAQNQVGGAIQTVQKDGWIFETGPNTILVTNTIFDDLLTKTGLKKDVIEASTEAKNRFIVKNGKTVALPLSPVSFFTSSLFSAKTKLNLLGEPFRSRMTTYDEPLSEFVKRRLGKEFLDYAINPFVAGVYAGSPDKLSVRYGFPKLYELENKHGSLIKGAFKGPGKDKDPVDIPRNKAKMISFTEGNAMFPKTLSECIGKDAIKLNKSVKTIQKLTNHSYIVFFEDGDSISCNHLILTVPAHILSKIEWLDTDGSHLIETISEITYPQVNVLHFGFKKDQIKHPLNGFGMLVPEVENRFILGALFNSTLFPQRTPGNDENLITVFTGGSRHPEIAKMSDNDIESRALKDLCDILEIKGDPVIKYQRKWKKAIPQYTIGYENFLSAKSGFESKNAGIYLSGNYFGGISVGDCIKNGWKLSNLLTRN